MTPTTFRHGLAAAWSRLRGATPGAASAVPPAAYDPNTRINDGERADWMATARPAPPFTLDACLDAPSHVPGWMLEPGTSRSPTIDPVRLPNRFGFVTTADAAGQAPLLATHYRHILQAAPRRAAWRQDIARFACFAVDLVIAMDGEHPLRIEMFGGAAMAATALLGRLADPAAPDGLLYDNLDQGWALRMTATATEVFTLEWNWERPADEDEPRALRFPRHVLASQARGAVQRLEPLHAALTLAIGSDLWNVP